MRRTHKSGTESSEADGATFSRIITSFPRGPHVHPAVHGSAGSSSTQSPSNPTVKICRVPDIISDVPDGSAAKASEGAGRHVHMRTACGTRVRSAAFVSEEAGPTVRRGSRRGKDSDALGRLILIDSGASCDIQTYPDEWNGIPPQHAKPTNINMAVGSIPGYKIDDVVYVIDSGRVKETRYDAVNQLPQLVDTWASQASRRQRRRASPPHLNASTNALSVKSQPCEKRAADQLGATPLLLAAAFDKLSAAQALLECGARPDAATAAGESPLQAAQAVVLGPRARPARPAQPPPREALSGAQLPPLLAQQATQ